MLMLLMEKRDQGFAVPLDLTEAVGAKQIDLHVCAMENGIARQHGNRGLKTRSRR